MNAPIPERAYTETEGVMARMIFRTMRFRETGMTVEQHAHDFDHVTVIIRGPLKLASGKDGPVRTVVEGERILIPAGIIHGFTALADNCLAYCVHPFNAVTERANL